MRKEHKLNEISNMQQQKDDYECTFKPEINYESRAIYEHKDLNPIYERYT